MSVYGNRPLVVTVSLNSIYLLEYKDKHIAVSQLEAYKDCDAELKVVDFIFEKIRELQNFTNPALKNTYLNKLINITDFLEYCVEADIDVSTCVLRMCDNAMNYLKRLNLTINDEDFLKKFIAVLNRLAGNIEDYNSEIYFDKIDTLEKDLTNIIQKSTKSTAKTKPETNSSRYQSRISEFNDDDDPRSTPWYLK